MNKKILYIEQKTDGDSSLNDRGAAVIGEVKLSKTGKTYYYKGKSFERVSGGGPCSSNYFCPEDKNYYWISGVKKDGKNRHWAGSGGVRIEA